MNILSKSEYVNNYVTKPWTDMKVDKLTSGGGFSIPEYFQNYNTLVEELENIDEDQERINCIKTYRQIAGCMEEASNLSCEEYADKTLETLKRTVKKEPINEN